MIGSKRTPELAVDGISHIPPLLKVQKLLGNRLPPAIFIVAPKGPQECDSCGHAEVRMEVEEFIHMAILPKPLQDTVRQEVRMVIYRRMEEDLRKVRSGIVIFDLPYASIGNHGDSAEDRILMQMAVVWPTLSDEHRQTLDDEGATCWPAPKPEFKGEF